MSEGDRTLANLLDLDGEEIVYEGGFVARFKAAPIAAAPERPHGIRYSLTLHDPQGTRVLGYDNAHRVPHRGGRHVADAVPFDHWDRDETDPGRPYDFTDAETLIVDFFDEIERILREREK